MTKYLDSIIVEALEKKKKVSLFICNDEEGGFGVKINGKIIANHLAWEVFEYDAEEFK